MTTDEIPSTPSVSDLATGAWRLDPARSSIEFRLPHFWGLLKRSHTPRTTNSG